MYMYNCTSTYTMTITTTMTMITTYDDDDNYNEKDDNMRAGFLIILSSPDENDNNLSIAYEVFLLTTEPCPASVTDWWM